MSRRLGPAAALAALILSPPGVASADSETAPGETTSRVERLSGSDAAAAATPGVRLRDYQQVLRERRLVAADPFSRAGINRLLEQSETALSQGRSDEALALLSELVESPRFDALRRLDEARAAVYVLGDVLVRVAAPEPARKHLSSLLDQSDDWQRRALARLVDLGLASWQPRSILAQVAPRVSDGDALAGDVAYLEGAVAEREGKSGDALSAYARVGERSRFWAQARYRSGLIQAQLRQLGPSETQFCAVAAPQRTPRLAPLFGGDDFFRVRDLSRLALGRVAHEQYRFDDARYYYHLVPGDSDVLPEALYESATASYEAKDYASARSLLQELRRLERPHPYEDEAWVLDAYVDLARCDFPEADDKLQSFLARYEPVLAAAQQLEADPRGLAGLMAPNPEDSLRAAAFVGIAPEVATRISSLLRVDAEHAQLTRQLAHLDLQLSGLRTTDAELQDLRARLANPDAVQPRSADPVVNSLLDRHRTLRDDTASLRRLLRSIPPAQVTPRDGSHSGLRGELVALEAEAAALQGEVADHPGAPAPGAVADQDPLLELLERDALEAKALERELRELRRELVRSQRQLAQRALGRLGARLTRLIRQAQAGRIETVLGRKRAIEMEIEALSEGYLPPGAIDSLDAARYLRDDEEYWPFDGEDWEDEYVGGEGLR